MKVYASRKEVNKLRKRMLDSYPKERIEIIWGLFKKPDEFHIFAFDSVEHKASRNNCEISEDVWEDSQQRALKLGFVILGTIHSHPNCADCAPSETDYDNGLENGEILNGICLIDVNKNGRRRTYIRFWGPLQKVELSYRS